MSSELENFVKNNREAFNTAIPSNDVLAKLQQNILLHQKKEKRKLAVIKFIKYASAACVIAILASSITILLNQNSRNSFVVKSEISNLDKVETTLNSNSSIEQLDTILQENKVAELEIANKKNFALVQVKNKLIADLQNMDAPSKRYNAAVEMINNKQVDKQILMALSNCLNNDPNTNVRLAALESLSMFYREPMVKKELISSLQKQKDPIVKMSLIDVLTKLRVNNLGLALEKMVNDQQTPKPVKDQAYQSIHTLSL